MEAVLEYGQYLVRVSCVTYNHAAYITDAMNGFAMQQTDFPFVCTIIDDASTDGEQEVIREYLEHHFDLQETSVSYTKEIDGSPFIFARHRVNKNCYFAVTLLRENHYSRRKSKAPYLADWLDTKYVATCEGDDYWTDPMKLQKQIDYLENHPDCTLCFTNAIMHWEDGSGKPDRLFAPNLEERDYLGTETTMTWITPTASLVYRQNIVESDFYKKKVLADKNIRFAGDIPLVLTCYHFGAIHAINDVTCVYRRQPNGFMLSSDSNRRLLSGDHKYSFFKVFGKEYLESSVFMSLYYYRLGLKNARKEHAWTNYIKLLIRIVKVYSLHPYYAWKRAHLILNERKVRLSSHTSSLF